MGKPTDYSTGLKKSVTVDAKIRGLQREGNIQTIPPSDADIVKPETP